MLVRVVSVSGDQGKRRLEFLTAAIITTLVGVELWQPHDSGHGLGECLLGVAEVCAADFERLGKSQGYLWKRNRLTYNHHPSKDPRVITLLQNEVICAILSSAC